MLPDASSGLSVFPGQVGPCVPCPALPLHCVGTCFTVWKLALHLPACVAARGAAAVRGEGVEKGGVRCVGCRGWRWFVSLRTGLGTRVAPGLSPCPWAGGRVPLLCPAAAQAAVLLQTRLLSVLPGKPSSPGAVSLDVGQAHRKCSPQGGLVSPRALSLLGCLETLLFFLCLLPVRAWLLLPSAPECACTQNGCVQATAQLLACSCRQVQVPRCQ